MRNTEGSIICVACSSEIVPGSFTTTRNDDSDKIQHSSSGNNQDQSDEESDILKVQKLFDDKPPRKSIEVDKFNEAGYSRTICILEKVFISLHIILHFQY